VRFAVALNSFHEAVSSACDEGFDLTRMIDLALNHTVYIILDKLLQSFVDGIRKTVKKACHIQ